MISIDATVRTSKQTSGGSKVTYHFNCDTIEEAIEKRFSHLKKFSEDSSKETMEDGNVLFRTPKFVEIWNIK